MEKILSRDVTLLDTGIIYAMLDVDDSWHKSVKKFLEVNSKRVLIVPSTILPEVCYLINTYLGQKIEQKFIDSLAQGELRIENFIRDDLKRVVEMLKIYANSNIGFVDASIVAIAERLKIKHILTTDRRHFSIIKPSHCPAFILLP